MEARKLENLLRFLLKNPTWQEIADYANIDTVSAYEIQTVYMEAAQAINKVLQRSKNTES